MRLLAILNGLGVGAAMMYVLDPERGPHRRAIMRDRAIGFWNKKHEVARAIARDLQSRTNGFVAETRRRVSHEGPSDGEIYARVRVVLGHVGTHPEAVGVVVTDGVVKLTGHAMVTDAAEISHRVREIPGVKWIQNDLQVHASPTGVPLLQGRELGRKEWTPSKAALVGLGGAALALFGLAKRGTGGTVVGLVGGVLLAKAFADAESRLDAAGRNADASRPERMADHVGLA